MRKHREKQPGLVLVLSKISGNALAAKLGLSQPTVFGWWRVPSHHAHTIKEITGVPLHVQRPDLWRRADESGPAIVGEWRETRSPEAAAA